MENFTKDVLSQKKMIENFYGREQEISLFCSAVEEFDKASSLGAIAVLGSAGVGKTTLIHHVLTKICEKDVWTVSATGHKGMFHGIADKIFNQFGAEKIFGHVSPAMVAGLNGYFPTLRKIIQNKITEIPERSFAEDKMATFESLTILFEAIEEKPIYLWLDDFHNVTKFDLEFLQYLADEITERKSSLCLVFSYRDGEISSQSSVFVRKIAGRQRILLKPFEREESDKFIHGELGIVFCSVNTDFQEKMFQQTGGNPLYLSQTLEHLKTSGHLVRDEEGFWILNEQESFPWSRELREMISQRVRGVKCNFAQWKIVTCIALNQGGINPDDRRRILQIGKQKYNKIIDELIDKKILGADFQFQHPLFGEMISAEMTKSDAEEMNRSIAEYLRKKGNVPHAVLARYYGGIVPKNSEEKKLIKSVYSSAILELSDSLSLNSERKDLLIKCRKLEKDEKKRALLEIEIAKIEVSFGNNKKAERIFKKLIAGGNDQIALDSIVHFVKILANQARWAEFERILKKGGSLSQKINDCIAEVIFLENKMVYYKKIGQVEERKKVRESLIAFDYDTVELKKRQGYIFHRLSIDAWHDGDWENVRKYEEQSLAIGEKYNVLDLVARAQRSLAFCFLKQQDIPSAEKEIKRSFETYLKIGTYGAIAAGYTTYGQMLIYLGKVKEATDYLTEGIRLFAHLNSVDELLTPILNLVLIHQNLGEYSDGLHYIRKYSKIIAQFKDQYIVSNFLILWGNLLALTGNYRMAVQKMEAGILIAKRNEMDANLVFGYENLGFCYSVRPRPNYEKAYQYFGLLYNVLSRLPTKDENKIAETVCDLMSCCYYLKNDENLLFWKKEIDKHLRKKGKIRQRIIRDFYCEEKSYGAIQTLLEKSLVDGTTHDVSTAHQYLAFSLYEGFNYRNNSQISTELANRIICGLLTHYRISQRDVSWYFSQRLRKFRIDSSFIPDFYTKVECCLALLKDGKYDFTRSTGKYDVNPSLVRFGNSILQGDPVAWLHFVPTDQRQEIASQLVSEIIEEMAKEENESLARYFEREITALGYSISEIRDGIRERRQIDIQTFGTFECLIDGKKPGDGDWILSVRRLFAYLVCRSLFSKNGTEKYIIIDSLWGGEKPALLEKRFHQTMYRLRRALGCNANSSNCQNRHIIKIDNRENYRLSLEKGLSCDAHRFIEHYKNFQQAKIEKNKHKSTIECELAFAIYRGDFLKDMDEQWSQAAKGQLCSYYTKMTDYICRFYYDRREYWMVASYSREYLRLVPYDELGVFWSVKGLYSQKKRCAAEVAYRKWDKMMQEELEIVPEITFERIVVVDSLEEI